MTNLIPAVTRLANAGADYLESLVLRTEPEPTPTPMPDPLPEPDVIRNSFGWYGRGREVEAYMPVISTTDITSDLELMETVLEGARADNRKLIFRPRYNKDGSNVEAEFITMLEHVAAIGELADEFEDVIVVWQLGMVGRYGEFHGSTSVPDDDPAAMDDDAARLALVQATLAAFGGYIALRKPKWHQEIAAVVHSEFVPRLTVFDDCITCNDDDGGTFPDEEAVDWREYMAKLPRVGGEISRMSMVWPYEEVKRVAKQMNLAYANREWNPIVWSDWTAEQMQEFTLGLEQGWDAID